MSDVDTYKQLVRIGPRRSGRTVANLVAASMVQANHGTATVVVGNTAQIEQIEREWRDVVSKMGFQRKPSIATLQNVKSYRGPFFIDHYAMELMVASIVRENDRLRAMVTELQGQFL